jgi:hypothetical protein
MGQLSNQPPILFVHEMDIIMPKEDPQVLKVKLPVIPTSMCTLLPWEHQGIPYAHCCSPPHHQAEGAGREVLEA